jgi:hypothetical protein
MVISLERNSFERCYLWVSNNSLIIKDEGRSKQQKIFDSDEKAISECQKFVQRRLKNNWQIRSQTNSSLFYQDIIYFHDVVEQTRRIKGFDQLNCYLVKAYPANSSAIDSLKDITEDHEIPSDYRDFLSTVDGFDITQRVLKDDWGNSFSFCFVPTYRQQHFQEKKNEIFEVEFINALNQPFLVISTINESYTDFTGAIMLMESHKVKKIESGMVIGIFDSFRDYFLFEKKEIHQYLFDGRYWVESRAN